MSISLTKRTVDYSDPESFCFGFFCDFCEKEWKSQIFHFESGGFSAIENEIARQLIWAQEHKTAFEKANLEAHFHFSHNPATDEWLCDECFENVQNMPKKHGN